MTSYEYCIGQLEDLDIESKDEYDSIKIKVWSSCSGELRNTKFMSLATGKDINRGTAQALVDFLQERFLKPQPQESEEDNRPCKHCGVQPWDHDSPCPDNPQVMGHEPA